MRRFVSILCILLAVLVIAKFFLVPVSPFRILFGSDIYTYSPATGHKMPVDLNPGTKVSAALTSYLSWPISPEGMTKAGGLAMEIGIGDVDSPDLEIFVSGSTDDTVSYLISYADGKEPQYWVAPAGLSERLYEIWEAGREH